VRRRATVVAAVTAVFVLLLASAAQARSPDSASARAHRPAAAVPVAQGGTDNGGDHGNGRGKGGSGNGNGGNADQGRGGNGGGRGHAPGVEPHGVSVSASAASAQAIANALAAAQRASAKLHALLARLFGRVPGASTSPAEVKTSAVTHDAVDVAVADGSVAPPSPTAARAGAKAPGRRAGPGSRPPAQVRSSADRPGAKPLALPLAVAPPGDYLVSAVFGFLVLGLLWVLWMASLRPVLGRGPTERRHAGTHRR
jgi:hypothetical protein